MVLLVLLLFFAVPLSDGFNIDVLQPDIFLGNKDDFFGYRLLQYQSDGMKQIIVSAPLSANRTGAIYKCTLKKRYCSPLFQPECTKSKVNLVFLFDGSSSMTTADFDKNKKFIWDIVTTLKNSSIEFAAVQFSTEFRTVFTFKDYVDGTAKEKLDKEKHMKALTNTHRAINFILNNLFNNLESGADPEATKALVIITDGSPSDIHTNEIQRCEKLNITRFIIGVGNIKNFDKLNKLASEPKDSNIFRIENYNGLNGLLNKLQNKIYGTEDSKAIRFFGISMTVGRSPSATLTICSPSLTHECDGNSYLNGICYQFNSTLDMVTNITAAFQECTKSKVNLVFLFDGSSSMTTADFDKNKKFIWDIVTTFKNSSIEFAAVQFSTEFRTVFTFKDYVDGAAKEKLDKEKHMKALTNTHRAINFTLNNLFNNLESGADPEATKALVIITDGSPSDIHTNEIQRCEKLNIARFIIGVGNIKFFDKLNKLASEPKDSNIFRIENYNGLNGLLNKLQNKIYGIEGAQGRNYGEELSQSGFSAAADKDSLILGAVGSNAWAGMLYEVTGSEAGISETEIKDNTLKSDSYNGYSTAVGLKDGVSLVFFGAPRSNHRGQVTLYKKINHKWKAISHVSGEQIGSYFGGSVCVLDLDSDNDTDFLVVGAPLYYKSHPQREGQVYIYRVTQEMELQKELEVCESAKGRFGMTLAALADLNGDELQDLAVGAPLEDDQEGAIYIYLGDRKQGIRPKYSQKIVASSISKQLHYFGLAIDGVMDMEQDGLTDIAVGAQGTVFLLKTRPVVSVSAELRFSPSEINLNKFDCLGNSEGAISIITLSTCFSMAENTNSKGAVKNGLNISLEINADAVRQDSRAFFIKEDKTSRTLLNSVLLDSEFTCYNNTVYMHSCVKDTVSPVLFRLSFRQSDHQPTNSNSILNIDSRTSASVECPFLKLNCCEPPEESAESC